MDSNLLKLGTRRSLLAWSQSEWVARQIERLNPGVRVELVGIETRGDRILDVSLSQIQGKEFFVAELDDALKEGRVDFTVHSMKDLSLERPDDFVLAAIPPRENPRDILLMGPEALGRLRQGQRLRIGTSSPRRLENLPTFLSEALPQPCAAPEFVEIRGNVNTRLSRVHEAPGAEKYLDGVVLAFAGLIRLWANEQARPEIARLLQGVRWMVLPLRECPAAPAQGALAVECRAGDSTTRTRINQLHDRESERRVKRERALLALWGGGCHQRFGATAVDTGELGEMFYVRGAKSDGEFVEAFEWHVPVPSPTSAPQADRVWDGSEWRTQHLLVHFDETLSVKSFSDTAVFVAHSRAVPDEWKNSLQNARIWTSGTASWKRLAAKGLWVEGCGEGLGFDVLAPALAESVLQLPALSKWTVLTHDQALESWSTAAPVGEVIATYRIPPTQAADYPDAQRAIENSDFLYWGSGSQFDHLGKYASAKAHHACGAGKTARHLRTQGLEPLVFPSNKDWKKWLGI